MTRGAGDVAVAAQDRVEHERPPETDERGVLDGHRPDGDHAPALQTVPQLGIDWWRERLRRRNSVAASGDSDEGEAQPPDERSHVQASGSAQRDRTRDLMRSRADLLEG